jgi:selenocysteine-specific elongation factor
VTVVVGTAGHVDHGKTALLRALTGIDADRLPEERRRGMTIEVGYAHLALADGSQLDLVDVPGHDRLVGNMLVGAGEIDAALLVVAADDGPRAQTLEHLTLLDGLGIRDGLVAITKADLVDPAREAAVAEEVAVTLGPTTLAGSPVIVVSSLDRRGLEELARALVGLRDRVLARMSGSWLGRADRPVRLAIDRVFVVKGRGTVVTGSLRGGELRRDALVRVVPGERRLRARELQVHGSAVDTVTGGGRVALNLAAVEADNLRRGDLLTTDPRVVASSSILAVLRRGPVLGAGASSGASDPGWPPKAGSRFRLHLGTSHAEATLGRGGRDWLVLPDGRLVGRLRLAHPIGLSEGDPFVLRRGSGGGGVIGGIVLDALAPAGPSRRRMNPERLAALATGDPLPPEPSAGDLLVADLARVALHGVLDRGRLAGGPGTAERLVAVPQGPFLLAGLLVERGLVEMAEADALAAVSDVAGSAEAGTAGAWVKPRAEIRTIVVRALRRAASVEPGQAGSIAGVLLSGLVADGRLAQDGDQIHLPGRALGPSAETLAAMDRLERLLGSQAPPALSAAAREARCPADGVRALEASGRIIRLEDDLAYAAAAYGELARLALHLAEAGPLAPATLRDATGTSRKYVMAILEDLDRRGILRRTPEGHRPGPRAAIAATLGVT